jgi:hypothetical protein
MKRIIPALLLFEVFTNSLLAQSRFERTIPYQPGKTLTMEFTYPEIIKVQVHDHNEIKVEGIVSINSGLFDQNFDLVVNSSGNNIDIYSTIKDKDEIPHRITVNVKGEKYVFMAASWNDPKIKEFLDQHDKSAINWISNGLDIDIELTVTVPRNSNLNITSKFGTIEILGLPEQLVATSKHDGVDISVDPSSRYDFEIHTTFGEVYTNLDLELESQDGLRPYKAQKLVAHLNGGGKKIVLESKFGNVYLRKKQ